MEASNASATSSSPSNPSSRSFTTGNGNGNGIGIQFSPLRFLRSPVSSLLEYSGILRVRADSDAQPLISPETNDSSSTYGTTNSSSVNESVSINTNINSNSGEVSIRIIGEREQDEEGYPSGDSAIDNDGSDSDRHEGGSEVVGGSAERVAGLGNEQASTEGGDSGDSSNRDSPYQRYDIQQVARWTEQILPFSLLLLVVFIRQHLQGFFATIWITAFMFKSNDILRKQTALKGERKISVLVGYLVVFMLHVIGIYWWYQNDDIFYPLFMVPPKAIPPFWHAIFIILVNDTMVRQAAMALKLVLLMYFKNGRGHNFRRQGQMLTLVEYTLLLYRALLPTPVWYRFFLNKEYGSLFSSLTTGLYLTFKLTSIVEKVQSFYAALKALSRKEVHYGSYATSEQVNAAGDLCAICQEKMHAPILLRCKHIFCEECVSEWFERERTCPLCRALVRPADLRSYGDGSTSLFFQLF